MKKEVADALRYRFGYVPDEDGGEKWVVHQDERLIVIHPYRRIRVYKFHHNGEYYEIEPLP